MLVPSIKAPFYSFHSHLYEVFTHFYIELLYSSPSWSTMMILFRLVQRQLTVRSVQTVDVLNFIPLIFWRIQRIQLIQIALQPATNRRKDPNKKEEVKFVTDKNDC